MANFPSLFELSSLDGRNGFRIDGAAEADQLGFAVSSAGDVNGDGFADVIVGAMGAGKNGYLSGSAYVVFGNVSQASPATLNVSTLNGVNGYRIDGEGTGDNLGISVSSAGDVNGDGIDDLIVGGKDRATNADDSGAAYVVFGEKGVAHPSIAVSSLDGRNGFKLDSSVRGNEVGRSVSSAGDVNGDGFDDLIVGSSGIDGIGEDRAAHGASYVVFGKASGFASVLDLSKLDGKNGFQLDGDDSLFNDHLSVSSAGDVNGDGLDDVIVSVNSYGQATAAAYVVFGKRSGFEATFALTSLDGTDGFKLDGKAIGRYSTTSVSSAGDVNGDGFDDLIIGEVDGDSNEDPSASYVVFGKASGFTSTFSLSSLNGTNGFKLVGERPSDKSGYSVSSAGDVNGDGFDDLIVGAFYSNAEGPGGKADPGGVPTGASYVVFGKASGFTKAIDLGSLDGANGFKLASEQNEGRSMVGTGFSVSAAGDVNRDGFDDVIVGAHQRDLNGFGSGSAYIVYGHRTDVPGGPPTDIALSKSSVREFAANGALVGTLSAADPNVGDTFTYQLLNNAGGRFVLDGNKLEVAKGLLLDYEQSQFHFVNVRVTDSTGQTFDKFLKIDVTDINPEVIKGTSGKDTLFGGARTDSFDGLSGDDTLRGGGGADKLTGGLGKDTLEGEAGSDTFIYKTLSDSRVSARDTIEGFSESQGDRIDLRAIDAESGGRDQAFHFIGSDAFSRDAGELQAKISGKNTVVSGDVNGDGRADFAILLERKLSLDKGDFVL